MLPILNASTGGKLLSVCLQKDLTLAGARALTNLFVMPYQRAKEKQFITPTPAIWGNAHSEYIGPMAEMGFLGMLIMFLLVGKVDMEMRRFKAYQTNNKSKPNHHFRTQ